MPEFRMDDFGAEARKARLDPMRSIALAKALELAARSSPRRGVSGAGAGEDAMRDFLLPFAEFGLDAAQMLDLLAKVPEGWPLSHREMYYDFRLGRWQKHIEPPTLADCLEEYLENSPSQEEGLAYLREQWARFLERRAGPPGTPGPFTA